MGYYKLADFSMENLHAEINNESMMELPNSLVFIKWLRLNLEM
jgi:hypothetical protein